MNELDLEINLCVNEIVYLRIKIKQNKKLKWTTSYTGETNINVNKRYVNNYVDKICSGYRMKLNTLHLPFHARRRILCGWGLNLVSAACRLSLARLVCSVLSVNASSQFPGQQIKLKLKWTTHLILLNQLTITNI